MIQSVMITVDRDILAHQLFTGVSRQHWLAWSWLYWWNSQGRWIAGCPAGWL
ncbi:hypothetical protein ACFY8B_35670 [Streptomyces sp. NPDC012751]|uniref:hypothetical protein n=1 Tax=Streptomyces sp. NPDC012751 TaxID=3364846 RepID=UPI00368D9DE9